MTDQPAQEYGVRLSATFIPEGQVRLVTSHVGNLYPGGVACVITPTMDPDDPNMLVLELLTATPSDELADLLDMVVEGLRNGVVTSVAVDQPREDTDRG